MTYYLTLDNCFAEKHQLNLSQLYLFAFITRLNTWADKLIVGNNVFYKCSKKMVIKELPILTEKEDTIYRLMKSLEQKGLIYMKKIDGVDYVTTTEFAEDWGRIIRDSEINPSKLGNKSEKHSEIFPTDNNTIYNNNYNNQSESEIFFEKIFAEVKKQTPTGNWHWQKAFSKKIAGAYNPKDVKNLTKIVETWIEKELNRVR